MAKPTGSIVSAEPNTAVRAKKLRRVSRDPASARLADRIILSAIVVTVLIAMSFSAMGASSSGATGGGDRKAAEDPIDLVDH